MAVIWLDRSEPLRATRPDPAPPDHASAARHRPLCHLGLAVGWFGGRRVLSLTAVGARSAVYSSLGGVRG